MQVGIPAAAGIASDGRPRLTLTAPGRAGRGAIAGSGDGPGVWLQAMGEGGVAAPGAPGPYRGG